jgi:hypothetical protein
MYCFLLKINYWLNQQSIVTITIRLPSPQKIKYQLITNLSTKRQLQNWAYLVGVQCPGEHRPFFRFSHTSIPILCLRNPFRTNIPEGKILEIPSTSLFFLRSSLSFKLLPSSSPPWYMWQLLGYNIGGMVVLLTTFWNGNSWNSYVLPWRVRTVVTRSTALPVGNVCPPFSIPNPFPAFTNYNTLFKQFWTQIFPQVS